MATGTQCGELLSGAVQALVATIGMGVLYDVDDAQPDFVVYDRRDLPHWATTRIRTSGMPVLSYTIWDIGEMLRLAPHTDNVIFEGFLP